jgi:hypothetical protein
MRYWDINEVMTANEWLDIADDQQYLQDKWQEAQSKSRSKGRR